MRTLSDSCRLGNAMSATEAYLDAAGRAVALLGQAEVAEAWEAPSALAEMTVGGLAGHLAHQIFSVESALEEPASEQAPIPLLEHYARAVWIGAPLDGEANAGIRAMGEDIASEGARSLRDHASAVLAVQRTRLAGLPDDQAVFMPPTGWALSLGDFLTTRMVEFAVHMDDLAVSVGLATQELPYGVFDPVLTLLARLATRRHGQAAVLRALTRAERAPAAINAI
jgi:Mycothiol maleylpyruvate isomerase N-terminal domain